MANRRQFWCRYLEVLTLILVAQGISWTLIGSFDPFGIYDALLAQALFGTEALSEDASAVFRFALVPLGATDAAYFALAWFVVRHGIREGLGWAYRAFLVATLLWFVVDCAMSLAVGATFNVLVVNLPCLLLLAPAFWALRDLARE